MNILPNVKERPSLSKTLLILAHSVQMETGIREEEEEMGEEEEEEEVGFSSDPSALCPAHLPEINKADDDPNERQPQPIDVDDALRQPLHVHRHQVDHVPNCAGLSGAAGQSQDLGKAGGRRPESEGKSSEGGGGKAGRPQVQGGGWGLGLRLILAD